MYLIINFSFYVIASLVFLLKLIHITLQYKLFTWNLSYDHKLRLQKWEKSKFLHQNAFVICSSVEKLFCDHFRFSLTLTKHFYWYSKPHLLLYNRYFFIFSSMQIMRPLCMGWFLGSGLATGSLVLLLLRYATICSRISSCWCTADQKMLNYEFMELRANIRSRWSIAILKCHDSNSNTPDDDVQI